jgi:hypothetical protein
MAFYQSLVEALQPVRTMLSDNTQINDPENYSKLTGMLNFLFDPNINPRTIDTIMQASSDVSKYRPVEVKYEPHWGTHNLVTDDSLATCTAPNNDRFYIQQYNADLFAEDKFVIPENYAREALEDGTNLAMYLQDKFRRAMRVARESVDAQLLSAAVTNIGSNPAQGTGAGSYTDLQLIDSNSGADIGNFDVIPNDMEDNFMTGPAAVIGLGNARRYFNRLAVGNLNTNAGVNVAEIASQFNMLFYKDQAALSALGTSDRVLTIYPGLTQYFDYDLFNGEFIINTPDNLIKGTMPDPIYPIMWDYILKYDDGCSSGNGHQGQWVGRVFKYFNLFTVPERAFGDTYGELNDFTGIVGYNITSA